MNQFTENAIKIIVSVPKGHVMTYGQVARLAGSPRAARQVGWLLRSMSNKYKMPWHRIINSKGIITVSDGADMQKILLESEGIVVLGKSISLKTYLWSIDHFDFNQVNLKDYES